jgi:hypothetical protein
VDFEAAKGEKTIAHIASLYDKRKVLEIFPLELRPGDEFGDP